MTELSLYVLDIVQNSITAGAKRIDVGLVQEGGTLIFSVNDDGSGMSPEMAANVLDPFTTSRKTRRVGLGLPFLKMAAEQTGGTLTLESKLGKGTRLTSTFNVNHIDMVPMGDLAGTIVALIQGAADIRFVFTRKKGCKEYSLDTDELREQLGEDVPLNTPDVLAWIGEYITEKELEEE